MDNTLAYHIGQIIGVIIVLVLIIGLAAFFVIALIKAIRTRRPGWIIAASLAGVPFVVMFAAFMFGLVVGVRRGWSQARDSSAARNGQSSDLLAATMGPVTGHALPYEISLPSLGAWKKDEEKATFDYIFNYHDAYVGIIAENVGLGTPERVCDFSRVNLEKKATRCATTPPTHVEINGRTWLTYDAAVTIEGIDLKFRYFVYADAKYTIQLVTWTGTTLFERYGPVFDRIARSFKLPQPKEGV